MPRTRINITQGDDVVSKDVLAASICKLSDSVNQLLVSGLNEKAIIVLLQDSTGCSKRTIKTVIESMGQLRADYTHG